MSQYVAEDVRLSLRFTVKEFCFSQTAARYGLDNRLPVRLLSNARLCVQMVHDCERALQARFVLTSGYRSPALCKLLGSSEKSYHCQALAVDGRFDGVPMLEACRQLSDSSFQIVEIEAKQTQLHLAYGPYSARRLFQQFVSGGPVESVEFFTKPDGSKA